MATQKEMVVSSLETKPLTFAYKIEGYCSALKKIIAEQATRSHAGNHKCQFDGDTSKARSLPQSSS